jgi:hypothetical protein
MVHNLFFLLEIGLSLNFQILEFYVDNALAQFSSTSKKKNSVYGNRLDIYRYNT